MLVPGGNPEKMQEPPLWWCDEDYARENQRTSLKEETVAGSARLNLTRVKATARPLQLNLF